MAEQNVSAAGFWLRRGGLSRPPFWLIPILFGGCFGARLLAQTDLADASRMIQEQDARQNARQDARSGGHLGAAPGTIVLDRPARLDSSVTLSVGRGLRIAAPLTFGNASIRLAGHNHIECTAAVTVENATDLFVADGATDLSVHGCNVTVTGRSGGYLLTATRAARVQVSGNHLLKMAIFNTHNVGGSGSETTDVAISDNSTKFPPGTGPIGVYLLYVLRGTVANNRLEGTGHGIQWWGGDANEGWRGFDAVTGAGQLKITGNTCHIAGGSCVWGSDGFDIAVTGNTADLCSDVCFDTEGGVRTTFAGNTARACANGCYAAEFESLNTAFTGNQAFPDQGGPGGTAVLIKHPSGRVPNHLDLTIAGNTFTCAKLCAALYSEGEDGFTFDQNVITNGFLQFINYAGDVAIRENQMRFTVPAGTIAAITGPALANGRHSEIANNVITATAGAAGDAPCIAQGWSDYNNTDTMRITQNTCSGFHYGIATATGGGNSGAPHAVWFLQGNRFRDVPEAHQIVHQHSSGNEIYTSVPATDGAK